MEFLQFDLGYQQRGAVAVVSLSGTEANVQLLDSENLNRYKTGRTFNYYGGHYKASPARIVIPHTGGWHVIADLGGNAGQVKASVRVIR